MKKATAEKALIALTTLATAGAASAQSSVTLFGVIDGRYMYSRTDAGSLSQIGSGGTTSSRFGLRGVEDLGDGLNASFWIESNFATDTGIGTFTSSNNQPSGLSNTGGLAFNFRSTVSLAGPWGEVRLGRDFVPSYRNYSTFDPWGDNGASIPVVMPTTSNGLGIIPATTMVSIRASNQLAYFLPANLGGFYGQASIWAGENPSNSPTKRDGSGYGFRIGYAAGPLDIAVSGQKTDYAAGDARQINIGGAYKIGDARLMGLVVSDKLGTTDAKGWEISTVVPIGLYEIRAAYSRYKVEAAGARVDPEANKIGIGLVYNLSKRSALYGTYGIAHNKNGARVSVNGAPTSGPNQTASGIDLGLRHFF